VWWIPQVDVVILDTSMPELNDLAQDHPDEKE
jgi:hypothetical protein